MKYYWGTLYTIFALSVLAFGAWLTHAFIKKKTKPPYEGEAAPDINESFLRHYCYYSFKIGYYFVMPIAGPLLIIFGLLLLWAEVTLIFDL